MATHEITKNKKQADKNYKISNLRIICILLVVFAHSIIIYKDGWNYYSTDVQSDFLNYLCQFIYLFHMPLFFSLSGYLVYYSYRKKPGFKELTIKKFKRLIIPFLCIGLLYMLPIRYLSQYPNYAQNSLTHNIFINILLGQDAGHLWFLPTLFLIFLLHFLAIKYIKNENVVFILSIILFGCSFLLPSYLGSVAANFIWFHFGYMINAFSIGHRNRTLKYCMFGAFVVAAVVYFCNPGLAIVQKVAQFVAAFAAILFLHAIISNQKPGRAPSYVEQNSFGIYLLHSPLIYITFCFLPFISPVFMVLINFVVLGLVAFCLSHLIRKTKIKGILGE